MRYKLLHDLSCFVSHSDGTLERISIPSGAVIIVNPFLLGGSGLVRIVWEDRTTLASVRNLESASVPVQRLRSAQSAAPN